MRLNLHASVAAAMWMVAQSDTVRHLPGIAHFRTAIDADASASMPTAIDAEAILKIPIVRWQADLWY